MRLLGTLVLWTLLCDAGTVALLVQRGDIPKHEARLDAGADKPCAISFKYEHTGLDDNLMKFNHWLLLARSYGCALIVPSPHEMLIASHNDGDAISPRVWWDRYVILPDDIWRNHTGKGRVKSVGVSNKIPSREMVQNLVAQYPDNLVVVEVGFTASHFYYGDFPDIPLQIERAISQSSSSPVRLVRQSKWNSRQFPRSKLIMNTVAQIRAELKNGTMIGLHLRRGDRTGEYPCGCSNSPAMVAAYVRQARLDTHCRPASYGERSIFIATDEGFQPYLQGLRQELKADFKKVYFESHLKQLDPFKDNYQRYMIVEELTRSDGCGLDFHDDAMQSQATKDFCCRATADLVQKPSVPTNPWAPQWGGLTQGAGVAGWGGAGAFRR